MIRFPLILAFGLAWGGFSNAQTTLVQRIEQILDAPEYRHARWGALFVDSQNHTLYERSADQMFIPASVTKIFSCSTALAELGSEHRFVTPVYSRGPIRSGVLVGDLILRASGDLSLGGRDRDGKMLFADDDHIYAHDILPNAKLPPTDPLRGLRELARGVAQAGIRQVMGDVLIDDRLFAKAYGSGSGPGLITPILVNDNVIDFSIKPAERIGEYALYAMIPSTNVVQADVLVRTVEANKPAQIEVTTVGPQRIRIRGEIPLNSPPTIRIWPVDDPAFVARGMFIECLRQAGVDVRVSELQTPRSALPDPDQYNSLRKLTEFQSLPLREAIKVTLKVSHNLYASTLPALVAAKYGERTTSAGLRRQQKFLAGLGLNTNSLSFGGGAGGHNADLASPRVTVQLLQRMTKRPEFEVFRDALPILGVDGTLAEVVPASSPARGQVFAKTGTLSWRDEVNDRMMMRSKALAGYMRTAGGSQVIFALFLNDLPLPPGEIASSQGKVLAKVCETVYRFADPPARPLD